MLIVARILILGIYVGGLSLVSPVSAQSSVNKITVSHSHVISDHHHKHDHNSGEYGHHHHHHDEGTTDNVQTNDETGKGGQPVHHSHSFTICGAPCYCVIVTELEVDPLPEVENRLPALRATIPPKDLSLGGIFRPPIA